MPRSVTQEEQESTAEAEVEGDGRASRTEEDAAGPGGRESSGDRTEKERKEGEQNEEGESLTPRWLSNRVMITGGAVVAVTLFLVVFSVGEATASEARLLLQSAFPTIRFLASSILTVASTILALMLTLLGFSQSIEHTFSEIHYQRIRQISMMNLVAIISSVGLLLLMGVPLEESETLRSIYAVIYYVVLSVASLLGGLVVAMVLLLHRTIYGLTRAVGPWEETGDLIRDGEAESDGAD